jgi:sec-independent protein translocase protein TatC
MSAEPSQQQRYRPVDPKYMTLVEHLSELRRRLLICVLAITAGSIVGWFLAPTVIGWIEAPVREYISSGKIIVPTVYGGFTLQLKLAVFIGFGFALPVTTYQLWAFIAPAFGPAANRWAPLWITSALVLFVAGAATGYGVFPLAIRFFAGFQSRLDITILPFADQYVGFIALILLIFGVSFELPLALVTLSAAGITSSRWLGKKRLHFFFGIFIFAMLVTPGADPVSPLILGGILYILFELAIFVSKLLGK